MNARTVYTDPNQHPDYPKFFAIQCWRGDRLVFTYHCAEGLTESTEYWARERHPGARIKTVAEPWIIEEQSQ